MSVVLDKVTEVESQVVGYVAQVKDPVATGVTTVVDFVLERVPEVPALPYADRFATPQEVIDSQYQFISDLIATNKEIAESVVKAAAPLTNQLLARTAPKAAKAAPKVAKPKAKAAKKG